ncbi:Tn3 family transposase, partial [Klebsiella pneumoniae]|nr:Tn3 family transposase [Klebsiella pneumoniae]MDY9983308.1 Tn3 family transposase [Klebsiella pneumoniae]MDZ0027358.1 Tn3 family transposase [Klebsiella pneumoniae]MDZ0043766.1 Tn3 family transposase [Klebsiella pneumoniae]MDZ0049315.1 Tn3 family transposase [Klebsiella pneumoniae]
QNDVTLKMPAFEWVHVQLHQQKGMISLSPPTICNSAGRINKTLYLLNYIDDEDYRRRILTQLNRGESRHAVARAICHGQKGEIRKRYTDGQEDQLGALGLVTNAVVLWNTIYMQAALDHLRAQGETLNDEDIARLSPLCHGHINMLGHYSFTLAELVTKGHLRPLKEASEAENVA